MFLVSQASSEHNTTFALKSDDADLAVAVLNKEFEKEIEIGEITSITAEKTWLL